MMKSSISRRQAVVRTPVGNKTKRGAELEGTPKTPRAMDSIMLISPAATSRSMSVERLCLLQEAELSSFPPSRTRRPLHWSVNAKQGLALTSHHRHQQHHHHLLHDAGINTSDMSKNDKDHSLQKPSSAQLVSTTDEQKLNSGLHSIQVSSSSSSSSPSSASASASPLSVSSSSSSAAALSPICLNAIAPASVNDPQHGDSCGFRLKKLNEPHLFYSKQLAPEWRESSRISERGPPNLRRNGRVFVWSNAAFDQNIPVKTANETTSNGRANSCGSCDSSSSWSYNRQQQETDSPPDDAENFSMVPEDHQQEVCFVENSPHEHVHTALQQSEETSFLQDEAFTVLRSEEETWKNEASHVRSVEPADDMLAMEDEVHDDGPAAELLDSGDRNKEIEVEAEAEAEASSGKAVIIQEIDAEIEVLTSRLTELQMQKQRWEGELKKKKKKKKRTEVIDHGADMAESGADGKLKNDLVKETGSSSVLGSVKLGSSTTGRKWSDGGVGEEQDQRAKAYRRLSLSTATAAGDGDGGAKVLTKQRDQQRISVQENVVMPSSCRTNNALPSNPPSTPSRIVASRYYSAGRSSVTAPAAVDKKKNSISSSIPSVPAIPNKKKRDRTTCRSFTSSPPLSAAMAIGAASPGVVKRAITTRSGYPSRSGLITTPVKSLPPPSNPLSSAPSKTCSANPPHLRHSDSSRQKVTTTSRSRRSSSSCHSHSHSQQPDQDQEREQEQLLMNSGPKSTAALYQCLESLVEDSKNFFKRISPVRSRSSSISVAAAAAASAPAPPQLPPTPPPLPCIYTCRSSVITSSSSSDAHHHHHHHHRRNRDHAACDSSSSSSFSAVKRPLGRDTRLSFFAEKRSSSSSSVYNKIGVEKEKM